MKTYQAIKPFRIEQTDFEPGDVLGSGDVEAGEFTPVKGKEWIELGHVIARLQTGMIEAVSLIVSEPKEPQTPAKRGRKSKGIE